MPHRQFQIYIPTRNVSPYSDQLHGPAGNPQGHFNINRIPARLLWFQGSLLLNFLTYEILSEIYQKQHQLGLDIWIFSSPSMYYFPSHSILAVWYKTKFGSQNIGYQLWFLFCNILNIFINIFNVGQKMIMWQSIVIEGFPTTVTWALENLEGHQLW